MKYISIYRYQCFQHFPDPVGIGMAGRHLFVTILDDLFPLFIMNQIIGAFINQLVHGGVGFQIYTDCKVIGQLALKVCHKEAATAEDIADASITVKYDLHC